LKEHGRWDGMHVCEHTHERSRGDDGSWWVAVAMAWF
jgi:hypothetical protein